MSYCPCYNGNSGSASSPSGTKIESYVKVDTGSTVEPYVLPVASKDVLGGIKVGDGLLIDEDGVLSLDPEEACDCGDDQILDGGDADGEIDYVQYLDGGSAAGI